jgi:putative intracellular protease/amidase
MKNYLCYLYEGFVDFEIGLALTEINLNEKLKVIYIAYESTPLKSSAGMTIIPDKTVSEITSSNGYDGIIIPGGFIRPLKPELKDLLLDFDKNGKLIAAICGGPEFLAKAGMLKGRKYTTSMFPKDYEESNEPDPFPRETYIETRLVKDANMITARGHAFVDFVLEIWDWLDLYDYDAEKEECKELYSPS